MPGYLVRLRLESPLATPIVSGTLFGQLCWAWRELEGEDSLVRWLESLPTDPFLLSSACPAGFLPRPLLKPWRPPAGGTPKPGELERLAEDKRRRKAAWVRREDFLALRASLSEEALLERLGRAAPELAAHRVAHNTIDRLTGTTPQTGGLYFADELWPRQAAGYEAEVYMRTSLEAAALGRLLEHVGLHGYGRDASLGRGRWTASLEPFEFPPLEAAAPRRMSLSHGSLSPNMTAARYRLQTHYGRLGGAFATLGNPFKHPVTLLRPGATFQPAGEEPFGELLAGVHPADGRVLHNAWHFTVPYLEVES